MLVTTEVLAFYGQHHEPGDEQLDAADARRLLQREAFADLDRPFDAPVQRMQSYAADRATGGVRFLARSVRHPPWPEAYTS